MSGDRRRAAQAVQALEPVGILAAVHHGGVLSLLLADGSVPRIICQMQPSQSAAAPDVCDLIQVTGDLRQVIASGSVAEMNAFRDELADRLNRRSATRNVSNIWVIGVLGLGMVLGASAWGSLQAGARSPAIPASLQAMLAGRGMPPGGLAAALAGRQLPPGMAPGPMPMPPGVAFEPSPAPPIVAVRRGDQVRPATPVPLDDPDERAPLRPGRPAGYELAPLPGPPAEAGALAPPAPLAAATARDAPAVPPPSAQPLPAASPSAAAQPAAVPTAPADVTNLEVTPAQMQAMQQARDILLAGRNIPASLLAAMPEPVAAQIRASGRIEAAADAAAPAVPPVTPPVAPGGSPAAAPPQGDPAPPPHDRYGISSTPDANSWARLGAVRLPMPGAGDIQSEEDMRRFGFAPVNPPGPGSR